MAGLRASSTNTLAVGMLVSVSDPGPGSSVSSSAAWDGALTDSSSERMTAKRACGSGTYSASRQAPPNPQKRTDAAIVNAAMPAAHRVDVTTATRPSSQDASQVAAAATRVQPVAVVTKPSAIDERSAPATVSSSHAHARQSPGPGPRRARTPAVPSATRQTTQQATAESLSNHRSIPTSSCPMRTHRTSGSNNARGPAGVRAMTTSWATVAAVESRREPMPTPRLVATTRARSPPR